MNHSLMVLQRWLPVVSYFSIIVAFRMECRNGCVIENLKPQSDGMLMFRNLPTSDSYWVTFVNLQTTVVTKEFLNEIGQFVNNIRIVNSSVVQKIVLPKQCNLQTLGVSNSRLRIMEIEENNRLNSLGIYSSFLKEIPSTFRYLHAATEIAISESPIMTLDLAPFCSTPSLRMLRLKKNKIRYIINSSTIPCNPIMEGIQLDENQIQVLNLELFSGPSRLLNASFKKNVIEQVVGCFTSSSLSALILTGNYLTHLDFCQWKTPLLRILNIDSNRLSDIPGCLENLSQLEILDMHRNRFTHFHIRSVAKLKHLEGLNIGLNNLSSYNMNDKEFPPSLDRIYLGYNRLETLDLSYVPVSSLAVYVNNNLISELDMDKVSQNVEGLVMENNPIDCTWFSKTERMFAKCIKTPNFDLAEAYNGDASKILDMVA